jgi:predicted short-subunit dehydrogenase-like oxidoreductase (DUF2520 family)
VTDRVFILGAGRAGRGLARAFRVSGVDVVGLHGRRAERSPDAVSAGVLPASIRNATAIIVAVRDAQLDDALGEIAAATTDRRVVVLHASGSAEPARLTELRRAGHSCGTFHPLVPIADPARAAELFKGAWVGVDGDAPAIATADRLAGRLGARTLRIPAGEKARYHVAAVLASNFPTVLATLAALLLTDAGVPPDESWDAVRALMRGAVLNLDTDTPLAALTGPVVRGDAQTVKRHLAALSAAPELRRVYVELSRAAVEIARAGGSQVDDVERALDYVPE